MNTILEKMKGALGRLHWPAVIALALIIGAVYVLPESRLEKIEDLLTRDWSGLTAAIMAFAGLLGLTQSKQLVKPADGASTTSSTPPEPTDREAGFALVSPIAFIVIVFLFVSGCALVLSGCGASALRQHGTAALIATRAVAVADDAYLAHLDATQAACSDEACVLAAHEAHRPAEAAIQLARVAARAYADAVEIATDAEEGADVIALLVEAAMRVVQRYADVVRAMAGFGVDLPDLPIGGAS